MIAALADKAARISAMACDVSELVEKLDLKAGGAPRLRVAYHSACSLQHGQKITASPWRRWSAPASRLWRFRGAYLLRFGGNL